MLYQNKIGVYRMWLCIFVAGIFLGTILMNLGGGLFLGDDGIFSMASLNRIRYLKVDGASFFSLCAEAADPAFFVSVSGFHHKLWNGCRIYSGGMAGNCGWNADNGRSHPVWHQGNASDSGRDVSTVSSPDSCMCYDAQLVLSELQP